MNYSKFTVIHDNIKIHFNTEKEVKEYIDNHRKVIVYEHKVVFERTDSHLKIDRL